MLVRPCELLGTDDLLRPRFFEFNGTVIAKSIVFILTIFINGFPTFAFMRELLHKKIHRFRWEKGAVGVMKQKTVHVFDEEFLGWLVCHYQSYPHKLLITMRDFIIYPVNSKR